MYIRMYNAYIHTYYVSLSHEAKFKQDAKPRSDCFIKNKKDIF